MSTSVKLPILLSVPHGGTWVPPEVKKYCLLTIEDILLDGDTWSRELFALPAQIETILISSVARAVVDLNRDSQDQPPNNPDGVVKMKAVFEKTVWNFPEGMLPKQLITYLLKKYYYPYHKQLTKIAAIKKPVLAIDCHTMLDVGPVNSLDEGKKRPDICISNRGNEVGEPKTDAITAPPEMIRQFADVLRTAFPGKEVAINKPFSGGHIVAFHGQNQMLPWMQLEFNRSLYIKEKTTLKTKPSEDSRILIEDIQKKMTWALTQII